MFRHALSALQTGKTREAENLFKKLVAAEPRNVAGLNLLAILLIKSGNLAEAETYMRRALREGAPSDAAFYNYGIILKGLGRAGEALEQFNRALEINPKVPDTWNNRGATLNNLGRYDEAVADFDKAISLNRNYAEAYYNKGNALAKAKRFDEALFAYDQALGLKPDLVDALVACGNAHAELRQHDRAFAAYDRALSLKPNLAGAWLGRGNVHADLKQYDDALAAYDRALGTAPDLTEAWLGRGNVYTDLKRYNEASAAYDRALSLKPDLAEAWLGRGNVFADLGHYDNAFVAFDHALALRPDLAEAWSSRGNAFTKLQRYDEAFAAYDRVARLDPGLPYVAGLRLNAKLYRSDWTGLETDVAELRAMVRDGKSASVPFVLVAIPSSPADQLQCARRYVQDQPAVPAIWRGESYRHDRIRVAYLSNNFHESAMTYLLAGMFERHDRSRFEVSAISFGAERNSPMRLRLKDAFEHFVDVAGNTDREIAELLRRSETDIAVDLMGFTADNRLNVLARRAAPIQVNYMGYPGTMGAPYIDYIIADRTVIPEHDVAFYSEQVVFMPDSYFVTDDRLVISDRTPSRAQCGLPDSGFVFCCFNSNYKIMPAIFDIWMRLLEAVDGSVLWLLEASPTAMANLQREARRRGVAPERLIFAGKMPLADHLARHRHADLFLDTIPYNAHTTTSDALWAGLPVLTCLGATFAGRVAASLLKAVGLNELITDSLEDYEALALKLARTPSHLAAFENRLACNRGTWPLFNTERFTRHLETAFSMMRERHQRGESPQAFTVTSSSSISCEGPASR
ncbi:MAG TPA: tetratricopeptide repeat protein [Xanthobacteraceae bacterium]|nr:tetratricopeptide repeat protein [Xanthobacteraceae bacterium]